MWELFDTFTAVEGAYILRSPVWNGGNVVVTCDSLPPEFFRPWAFLVPSDFPTVGGESTRVAIAPIRIATRRFRAAVATAGSDFPNRRFGYYFFQRSGVNGREVRVFRLP